MRAIFAGCEHAFRRPCLRVRPIRQLASDVVDAVEVRVVVQDGQPLGLGHSGDQQQSGRQLDRSVMAHGHEFLLDLDDAALATWRAVDELEALEDVPVGLVMIGTRARGVADLKPVTAVTATRTASIRGRKISPTSGTDRRASAEVSTSQVAVEVTGAKPLPGCPRRVGRGPRSRTLRTVRR